MTLSLESFFDERTFTWSHIVYDTASHHAAIIDAVLDLDDVNHTICSQSVDKLLKFLKDNHLQLKCILDTHVHADHLSGASLLRARTGAPIGIGSRIGQVQKTFSAIFGLADFACDGRQFDFLLEDNTTFSAGSLNFKILSTPGHTPACSTYVIGDMAFCGDLLFMPDLGCGRCDFPNGSAHDLYHSVTQKIYTLPNDTRLFFGHDYPKAGTPPRRNTTVGASKQANVMIPHGILEQDFINARTARDATLAPPKLLYYALLANIDAGALPHEVALGKHIFRIPFSSQVS